MGRVNSPSVIAEQRSLINELAHSNQEYIRKFENLRLGIGGPPTGHVGDDASRNRAVEWEPKTAAKSLSGVSYDNFEKMKSASDDMLPQEEETTQALVFKDLAPAPWSWPKSEGHMSTAFINTGIQTMPPVQDRQIPKTNAPMEFDQRPLLKHLEHCSMLIKNLLKEVDEAQYKISFQSRLRMKGGIAGLLEGERRELEKTWGATALQSAEQRLDSLLERLGELPRINKFTVHGRAIGLPDDNIMREGNPPSMAGDGWSSFNRTTGVKHPPEIPSLGQQPASKENDIIRVSQSYSSPSDGMPMHYYRRAPVLPSLKHHLSEEKKAKLSDSSVRERPSLSSTSRKRKLEMADMPKIEDLPAVDESPQSSPKQEVGFEIIERCQRKDSPVIAPSNELKWPLDQVLVWLAANNFSTDWQKTFESLNICGADFLALGRGYGREGEIGVMHRAVYPRLARVCTESGTGWDQGKEREEGMRLRRSIRKLSRDLESPHVYFDMCAPPPASAKVPQDYGPPLLQVGRPVSTCQRCRSARIKCDGKLPACTACENAMQSAHCAPAHDRLPVIGELHSGSIENLEQRPDPVVQIRPVGLRVDQDEEGGFSNSVVGHSDFRQRRQRSSSPPFSFDSNVISSSAEYMPTEKRKRVASHTPRALMRRGAPPRFRLHQISQSVSPDPLDISSNASVPTAAMEGPVDSSQAANPAAPNSPWNMEPAALSISLPIIYRNPLGLRKRRKAPEHIPIMSPLDNNQTLDPLDPNNLSGLLHGRSFGEGPSQVESEPGDSKLADMEEVDRLVSLWTTVKPP